jgi:hypothetical protein
MKKKRRLRKQQLPPGTVLSYPNCGATIDRGIHIMVYGTRTNRCIKTLTPIAAGQDLCDYSPMYVKSAEAHEREYRKHNWKTDYSVDLPVHGDFKDIDRVAWPIAPYPSLLPMPGALANTALDGISNNAGIEITLSPDGTLVERCWLRATKAIAAQEQILAEYGQDMLALVREKLKPRGIGDIAHDSPVTA